MKSWHPVASSHIDALRHDGDKAMHVRYKVVHSGPKPVYSYSPVSTEDYKAILARIEKGESVGNIIRKLEPRGVRMPDNQ